MLYSKLFGKTVKNISADEKITSAKLLYQAGYIRESTAGRFYFLPLGIRVQKKIIEIVKEEMDKAGAQEMVTPIFHPLSLWQETNRDKEAKFELTLLKDRRGAEFVPGGTAEEMMVDLVRKFQISYRDLPFNIYQFSNKFRDELRARGGLLRVREFIMKDAYSFHASEDDFKKEYESMRQTYTTIFERLGLKTIVVESDNGYIGGDYCHEFVVESPIGESRFLTTEDGSYAAHEDVANFQREFLPPDENLADYQEIEGVGIVGVAELAQFLHIPVERTTKTILFETEKGEVVAAALMGKYEVNEVKLKHAVGCLELKLASPETVKRITGAEIGYAGLINLSPEVRVIMDISLQGRTNFEMGANRTNFHSINVNFGRELPLPSQFYDIAMAEPGFLAPEGDKKLVEKRGIEVGNIFQLGYHYSKLMKNANFIDEQGKTQPYYMGCYGIGIGRSLASIVEIYHDEKGICWPAQVAPFTLHLVGLNLDDPAVKEKAFALYEQLIQKGHDILFDDRLKVSPGEKLADADLIGIPIRLVISKKTGDQIEVKERTQSESKRMSYVEVLKMLAI